MKDFLKLLSEMIGNSVLQGIKGCVAQIFSDIQNSHEDLTRKGAEG